VLLVHTLLLQVTVACIIAALFNNLLLPWKTTDWALENIASAYTAAASLLQDASDLQFAVYRHILEGGSPATPAALPATAASVSATGVYIKAGGQVEPAVRETDQEGLQPVQLCCSSAAGAATGGPGGRAAAGIAAAGRTDDGNTAAQTTIDKGHQSAEEILSVAVRMFQQQQQQQLLLGLPEALQSKLVSPLVAVQGCLMLEVQVWQQKVPKGLVPSALKLLLQSMLRLTDRLLALQIVVTDLPKLYSEMLQRQRQGGQPPPSQSGMAAAAAPSTNPLLLASQQQQQQHSAAGAGHQQHAFEGIWHLTNHQLLLPLHLQQTVLLRALHPLATAVAAQLLQPSFLASKALSEHVQLVEGEWQRSRQLFLQLRQQLHDTVRQQAAASKHAAQQQHHHHKPGQHHLPAAMPEEVMASSWGAVFEGVSMAKEGHLWVAAGKIYMQQLAFQFAFDSAISEYLHAAKVALQVHRETGH